MRRHPGAIFLFLAVVGLLWPTTHVLHSHADGHDEHGHGAAHVVHVAIHGHTHGPGDGHGHGTPHDGEDHPEPHVHAGDALGALLRPRTTPLDLTSCAGAVAIGLLHPTGPDAVAVAATRALASRADGPLGALPDRAIDLLVALGRLQI